MNSTDCHVLVVDDNISDVKLLVETLRREGFRITLAFNGEQGYHRALAVQPDLIVMDVSMPGTDGIVAGRLLKADPATETIPIIYLTSANDIQTRLETLGALGVDYITKPYSADEIVARIRIHNNRQGDRGVPAKRTPMRSSEEVLVHACQEYVRSNLRVETGAEALAAKFNVTLRVLNSAFLKVRGISAARFVKDARMEEAKRLLTTTCLPMVEIAEEVGYSGNANFSTAFKQHVGLPPSKYRWQEKPGRATIDPSR